MDFLVRALKSLLVFAILACVVLWFAARRGDRGYFEEEITINRSAPLVFRWITTDELLRRWISDVIKLEKIGPGGPPGQTNNVYRMDEFIRSRRVSFNIRIVRVVANQQLDLSVRPAAESAEDFSSEVKFKLLPSGDYTQLVFSSQTKFHGGTDQIFEPILTYATQRKIREDLARLKLMIEAETAPQSTPQKQ